jgi:hypothetical protein
VRHADHGTRIEAVRQHEQQPGETPAQPRQRVTRSTARHLLPQCSLPSQLIIADFLLHFQDLLEDERVQHRASLRL